MSVPLWPLVAFLTGLALGALLAWGASRRLARAQVGQQRDAFAALSAEALRHNGADFLQLARTELERLQAAEREAAARREQSLRELLAPVREDAARVDDRMAQLERERAATFGALAERLQQMEATSRALAAETQQLGRALRAPDVRGRWGEIQLERVVELAGMTEHCDFELQASVDGEAGRTRPDLVVRLPGGRTVVVDAKTPLAAYLAALDATDDAGRRDRLRQHAAQVRARVTELARKQYWAQFEQAPEFVVLFLPGEVFFSAALQEDPALLEDAARERVMLVTPTTLIALLRSVAYGWRQANLAENAREISRLGKELHERLATFGGHLGELGRQLDRAVGAYNGAVGALESRVLVSARRFRDLDGTAAAAELPAPPPIERAARQPQAAELLG